VLVGFPPGGGADVLTRTITEWLQARLGQPFIVENRPGAATNLATEAVVRAPADGYALLATTTSNLINGALYPDLKYDFIADIAPIACISVQPLALVATQSIPAQTVPEFIAYAKANPGNIKVGHFGASTISHLAGEAFKIATGIDFVHVPYRGSAPMINDLLGGHIDAAFDIIPASIEHIRSGTLRALAVTTATRSDVLPKVATVGEFIPGYEAVTVAGLGAPKGTDVGIIEKLNTEINNGLADPVLRSRLVNLGATVVGGPPAEFAKLIARETERWSKVIRTAGIKPT
jgi:tripartite-type tricarboxylate transporter receptor subunit TctC